MITSSNGNTFRVTGHLYGEFTSDTGQFPAQRPVTRSFDVFFDLRLNKRLSKQSWGWWFETPSRPLWRQSKDTTYLAFGVYCENFGKNIRVITASHCMWYTPWIMRTARTVMCFIVVWCRERYFCPYTSRFHSWNYDLPTLRNMGKTSRESTSSYDIPQ